MIDAFSLATAALAFGSRFFADDAAPTSKTPRDTGDGMGFISSVAKSFVKSRKDRSRTFKSPPRPRPRTVSQLTRGNKVSPKINQGPTLGVDAPKLGKIT